MMMMMMMMMMTSKIFTLITFISLKEGFSSSWVRPVDIQTKGWHPLAWSHEVTIKGLRIPFYHRNSDTSHELFAWRKADGKIQVIPNVCPHLGSRLDKGHLDRQRGHWVCPYHGLPLSENTCLYSPHAHVEHHGILWWHPNASEIDPKMNPRIPELETLEKTTENNQWISSRFTMDVDASWSDCYRNVMDLHHPPTVHRGTFGRGRGGDSEWDLRNVHCYTEHDMFRMKVEFQVRDGEMNNVLVYQFPSVSWNKMHSVSQNHILYLHVALRPIHGRKTRWYITAWSNQNKLPFFLKIASQYVLFYVTKAVAEEDKRQLSSMAIEEQKRTYNFDLPYDIIYRKWADITSDLYEI